MNRTPDGRIRLEVHFADRAEAGSCMRRLSSLPGVLLNILRGRVTSRDAMYELELQGPAAEEALWTLWSAASRSA